MKRKVYIETSVISYLTARVSRDLVVTGHQRITQEWWSERRAAFDVFVSHYHDLKEKEHQNRQRVVPCPPKRVKASDQQGVAKPA
jgi:hypothetical protein